MKVIIGSKNPTKIKGAKKAFEHFFENIEIEGVDVSSEVSEMPINNEIYLGAKNRVKNLKEYCKANNILADLYIAIEAGMSNQICEYMITNVAVIEDNKENKSFGVSARISSTRKICRRNKKSWTSKFCR